MMGKLKKYWKASVGVAALYFAGLTGVHAQAETEVDVPDEGIHAEQTLTQEQLEQLERQVGDERNFQRFDNPLTGETVTDLSKSGVRRTHQGKIIKPKENKGTGLMKGMLHQLARTKVGANLLSRLPKNVSLLQADQESIPGTALGLTADNFMMLGEKGFGAVKNKLLTFAHEVTHLVQQKFLKSDRSSASPYLVDLTNKMLEADAIASELLLNREAPDQFDLSQKEGRNAMAVVFDKMYERNLKKCGDEAQAAQLTRKEFIKEMLMVDRSMSLHETAQGLDITSEQRDSFVEAAKKWHEGYNKQTKQHWKDSLSDRIENQGNHKADFKIMKRLAKMYQFTFEEIKQMFEANRDGASADLDVKAVVMDQKPKDVQDYEAKKEAVEKKYHRDQSDKLMHETDLKKEAMNTEDRKTKSVKDSLAKYGERIEQAQGNKRVEKDKNAQVSAAVQAAVLQGRS